MARKMKDSGIEWIGEIPEGWEVHRIKNHFLIISGSGFKPELQGQSTGDFPVCKASDISSSGHYLHTSANYITTDFVKSQHFSIIPKGSILFAKIGEAMRKNNRSLCLCDCCVDNNCQGLVPKKISSEFSYYLFTCIDMTWFDNAGTIPCINNQKLYDCRFPFPSHDEQLLIANALNLQCTKINEILSHIRSSIEEYKKLKQAVITQAVTKGVRGEREMKDSEVEWIGKIPAEWCVAKAKYCVTITHGSDPKTEGSIPVYGSGAESFKTCGEYKEGPTVLIGRKGATLHIPHYIEGKYWNVDTAFDVKAKNNFSLPYYYYLATSFDYKFYISQTTLPGMTQSNYYNMFLPFPTFPEQEEIVAYLDAKCVEIDGLITKREQLVKELENYKKSLIYEVVTGKREV